MKRFRGRNGVEEEAFQPQSMKTAKKILNSFCINLSGYETNLLNAAGVVTTNYSPIFQEENTIFQLN